MARSRTAVVGLTLLAAAIAAWFLMSGDRPTSPAAPPQRPKVNLPAPIALEGNGGTGTDAPTHEAPSPPREVEDASTTKPSDARGSIEGTVTGWDGKPMAGLEIYLVLADEPTPPRAKGRTWRSDWMGTIMKTDGAGHYLFESVPPEWAGVVVARVSDTYEVRSAPVRYDGVRLRVDLALPPPATLLLRLASRTAEHPQVMQLTVEGEFVWFDLRPDDPWIRPVDAAASWGLQLEEEGRLVRVRATPGRVKLQVLITNGPMVQREANLVSGESTEVLVEVPGDGIVRGRIIDPHGRPMSSGRVFWYGDRYIPGEADEHGRFRLFGAGTSPGTLRADAWVEDVGLLEGSRSGVLPDGDPVELVFPVAPRVRLRVDGLAPGVPVRTAVISRGRTAVSRGEPASDGLLEFHPHAGEPTLLALLQPDRAPIVIDLPALREGEDRDLGSLRFTEGLDLDGRITDGEGVPIRDAEVAVAERWSNATTRTDSSGRFRFTRLPPRALLLRVRDAGYPQHLASVNPTTTPKPEIVVTHGGFAAMRVVDLEGTGIAGASVTAYPLGEFPYDEDLDQTSRSVETDGAGKAQPRMCTGPRRLRAHAPDGRRSEDVVITIRESETTDVTLVVRE